MKNIYWKGKIYEGVTPEQFGRHDHWNIDTEREHNEIEDAYIKHFLSFPSIPCPQPHPFKDGQEVTELYKLTYCNSSFGYTGTVAVPLNPIN